MLVAHAGVVVGVDLGGEEQGPELGAGDGDDGRGGGVGGDVAVPVAEDVGGLVEARVVVGEGRVGQDAIQRVGEALGDEEIELGVGVGLDGQHVGGSEAGAILKQVVDALDAVGIAPVVGDEVGVVVGGDARVGGDKDSRGGVEDRWKRVVGNVAGPGLGGVERVDGDGRDGRADGVGGGGEGGNLLFFRAMPVGADANDYRGLSAARCAVSAPASRCARWGPRLRSRRRSFDGACEDKYGGLSTTRCAISTPASRCARGVTRLRLRRRV